MMLVPSGVRVHIALGVTDMRKGLDGLGHCHVWTPPVLQGGN